MASLADDRSQRTFLGHPRGLYVLFFAETWERFSYYGMRAILIFYLTKHFLFGEEKAYLIYGAYTSLVYITPVIGGYLADRYLGARKAVFFGGVLIAAGHLMIAVVEGPQAVHGGYLQGFYLALAFIIVGTGFLKANVATIVGDLYRRDDIRRDPAYSIFYMGINVGGAVGPIICGVLGETVGWSWGFGAAGIGMLAGLLNFALFQKTLGTAGLPRVPALLRERTRMGISREAAIYLGGLAAVAVAWLLIQRQEAVGLLLTVFAVLTFALVLWRSLATLDRVARQRVFAALFLVALNPLFWGLFEQAGSSLNIFTDQRVDRVLLGFTVPASLYQSINSIFIILIAPMLAALWPALARRGLEPGAPAKFGIGLILVGAGFLVLVFGTAASGAALVPAIFMVALYLLHTIGELCFSPVGMSAMTRLSVGSMVGLMMGTWYLAMAGGNFVAGMIARATGGVDVSPDRILEVYSRIGWFAMAVGVFVIFIGRWITRLMHLDTIGDAAIDHALPGEPELAEPMAPGFPMRA